MGQGSGKVWLLGNLLKRATCHLEGDETQQYCVRGAQHPLGVKWHVPAEEGNH